jgi:Cdc6-like AAA superfamily ATPase
LLITGESGVGKTTLCKKYVERYPRIDLTEKTKVPVLLARIPFPATPKNLVTVLLAELGDPLSDKGTTFSKTKRLFKLLKECEVELIILDEFQHFIDRDSDKVLNTISDWLKQLINESKLPIVLVGLSESIKILEANSQLRRRFAMSDELTNFDWVGNSNPENSNKNENNKSNTNKEKRWIKVLGFL